MCISIRDLPYKRIWFIQKSSVAVKTVTDNSWFAITKQLEEAFPTEEGSSSSTLHHKLITDPNSNTNTQFDFNFTSFSLIHNWIFFLFLFYRRKLSVRWWWEEAISDGLEGIGMSRSGGSSGLGIFLHLDTDGGGGGVRVERGADIRGNDVVIGIVVGVKIAIDGLAALLKARLAGNLDGYPTQHHPHYRYHCAGYRPHFLISSLSAVALLSLSTQVSTDDSICAATWDLVGQRKTGLIGLHWPNPNQPSWKPISQSPTWNGFSNTRTRAVLNMKILSQPFSERTSHAHGET